MQRGSARTQRASEAVHTIETLHSGKYTLPSGAEVDISDALKRAVEGTTLYTADVTWKRQRERDRERNAVNNEDATLTVEVVNCTTLEAAKRLAVDEGVESVCVLNFASARNPGGGFLKGSQAQEESLARSSGLYACLTSPQGSEMYRVHGPRGNCLYSHHMIYSPAVPVFKDDDFTLLERPYYISFISSPAVNAGAVRKQAGNPRETEEAIAKTMRERIRRILCVAQHHQHRALVLGAFGCGVFRNRPKDVARWFKRWLVDEDDFKGAFDRVIFAVLDDSDEEKILPFKAAFGQAGDLTLDDIPDAPLGDNGNRRRRIEEQSEGDNPKRKTDRKREAWAQRRKGKKGGGGGGRSNRGEKRNAWNNGGQADE